MRAGDRWDCKACGEPLIGGQTMAGKVAPIEIKPSENGNVMLKTTPSGLVEATTLGGLILDAARNDTSVTLHMNHFATCPQADRFRPKEKKNDGD